MRNGNRIVVTGVGVIAPNGIGKDQYWEALKNGQSGVKPVKRFDTSSFKCKQAGEITDFKPEHFLGSKGLKNLDRTTRLLCSAAKLSLDDAKLEITESNADDIGVCTGTTLSSLWNITEFGREVVAEDPRFINPALFPGTVVNASSSQVSIMFNIKGFNTTVSTGFNSSLDALKYAIDFIRMGRVKAVLVGGAESLSLASYLAFYRLGFFAGLKGEELSCPFDSRRNGIILGEGAAVILVEDEEFAMKRKAAIYAEIKGSGSCFDAFKLGKYLPDAGGLKESMVKAINNSGLSFDSIDYISASANSVQEQDRLEAKAIKQVFGTHAYNVPVSSIKSMIGETFSAGGMLQVAASAGSLVDGYVSPTINYQFRDDNCDFDFVDNGARLVRVNNILINNYGPGGGNASLVISKY